MKRAPDPLVTGVFGAACLLYFILAGVFLRHHDLGWHLAAGDLIRAQGALPAHDVWSFTAGGTKWYDLSWLWDVLASALYQAGGFAPLIGLTVLLGGSMLALLARLCVKAGAGRITTLAGVFVVGVALLTFEAPLDFALCVAPQAVSLLLFLMLWNLLEAMREKHTRLHLLLAALLMVAWVNMHGGFLLYFLLAGIYAGAAWWEKEKALFRRYALLLLIGAAMMLVNPYGVYALEGVWRSVGGAAKGSVTEWQPYGFGRDPVSSAYLLVCLLLGNWRSRAIPVRFKMLAALFLVLGLSQIRHFGFFLLASLPWLTLSLTEWIRHSAAPLAQAQRRREAGMSVCAGWRRARARMVGMAVVAACIAASPPALRLRFGGAPEIPGDIFPREEIAYLAEHYPGAHVYNHWNFGGYLIFAARDSLKILIDGRADTAYPPEVINAYNRIGNQPELVRQYDLRVALMPRYIPQSLIYFEVSPEWKKVFEGKVGKVYERRTP